MKMQRHQVIRTYTSLTAETFAGFAETKVRLITVIPRISVLLPWQRHCVSLLATIICEQKETPYGEYKNPNIVNEVVLRAVSKYFNDNNIQILSGDFADAVANAQKGDFVYLDPPYDPVSNTASFTGYNEGGFNKKEQERLKLVCDELNKKGVKFLLSNSNTEFINNLYKGYDIIIVKAKRSINSNGNKRGEVEEVLIKNF